ncbi:unnamed protein product [Symbiodinium necroappetens]|uniref:Uncharacterized protein n=1 Tax=Symbiodinium necroappetens TaxID=1628268 RepID=A0A812M3Z8_9DINO|nr:unnamed protein product [Symbiodinium necroappetens]
MKPCTRAACSHCGKNVGLLGVTGFGVTSRRHEKRCKARRAAAAAMVQPAFCELLPRVDFSKDVQTMSAQEMGDMLTLTGAELKALLEQDAVTRQEVLSAAFVAWRPGACGGAPLKVAMVVGPGDSADTIQVQAETLRWGVMNTVLSVDCLDDGFLNKRAWGEGVAMMSGFDEVAAERCRTMQHVARRLAAPGGG